MNPVAPHRLVCKLQIPILVGHTGNSLPITIV
jgi:hypothetical protein